jgi:hypothetical protein
LLFPAGFFAFMALESLPGSQFWDRTLLLLTDPACRAALLERGHAPYLGGWGEGWERRCAAVPGRLVKLCWEDEEAGCAEPGQVQPRLPPQALLFLALAPCSKPAPPPPPPTHTHTAPHTHTPSPHAHGAMCAETVPVRTIALFTAFQLAYLGGVYALTWAPIAGWATPRAGGPAARAAGSVCVAASPKSAMGCP